MDKKACTPDVADDTIKAEIYKRYKPFDPSAMGFKHGAEWMREKMRSRLLPSNPESPSNEWIPVTQMPEKDVEVLIVYGGDVIQAYHDGKRWKGSRLVTENMDDGFVNDRTICVIGNSFDFVSAWMPLPSPPYY